MIITENEQNNETKPKKKKWKKIVLTILVIWIGLFLLRIWLEDGNSMKTTKSSSSNTFQGFANIKYGTKRNDAVKAMKKAGWTQIDNADTEIGGIKYTSNVFTKKGYKYAKHELSSVRLGFENHDYFVFFSVLFDTENMTDDETTRLIQDCTSISDFHFSSQNVAEDGSPIFGFQDSQGNLCVVGYANINGKYELSFDYYWYNGLK